MQFPPFSDFFKAATGHEPHTWQSELAQRLMNDDAPSRIKIPTGLGKTAAIPIAVYHLAWQLHHGQKRTAPQRIFHVVNRRTLVNDTHELIEKLSNEINMGADDSVIGPVRDALCQLLGPGDNVPIVVGSIHGETSRDTPWLRATGCSIVTLTPHQFVSRLLMRAFAVSPSRRPIDAGLVGVDRLVLFDEPDLATPAVQTILDAERLQSRATECLGVPLGGTVLLGATLPALTFDGLDNESVLKLDTDDPGFSGSVADRLLHAPKRLHLERAKNSSDADIAKTMATRATALGADGRSVVVFTNTVGLAQQVYQLLEDRWAGPRQLVTSRFRSVDREPTATDTGITVTTQCLEVGVDVSFDALVTEAASWSALVQRLGRLNRRGGPTPADAYLVMTRTGSVRAGTKAVYGDALVLAATELLERLEGEHPAGIDVSPVALTELRRQHADRQLDGEAPRSATLHAGLVPLMTHTRPSPSPDLPIEAFVAGPDRPVNREIEVAWREQVDGLNDSKIGVVSASEVVTVPRSALAQLLRGERAPAKAPISDLADATAEDVSQSGPTNIDLQQVRIWTGRAERAQQPNSIREALAAERIVLPCTAGGYDNELGWTGEPGVVDDQHLFLALRRLEHHPDSRRRTRVSMCLTASLFTDACDRLGLRGERHDQVRDLLIALAEADEDSLDIVVDGLSTDLESALQTFLVGVVPKGHAVKVQADPPIGINGPPAQRAVACTVTVSRTRRDEQADVISLDEHQEQVGAWAESDGRAAGLHADLVAELGAAGRYHDIGKAYPAFQRYLAGSPTAEVTAEGVRLPDGTDLPLLAKPLANGAEDSDSSLVADRLARAAAGLPPGFRHEAKSVEVARQHRLSVLAIHLTGSHHGLYHPVMPPLRLAHLEGYSHADDFTELNKRFGPWGLAYLEAVLRLADWRASANPNTAGQSVERHSTDLLAPLPSGFWNAPNQNPAESSDTTGQALPGLDTHPLTGWLASVGLLAAAVDLGDYSATLCWDTAGSAPQTPVLNTALSLRDIVARALDGPRWAEADAVVRSVLAIDGASLRRKNQKLKPANRLRGILTGAEVTDNASLVLGLVGDAAKADPNNQVELPIVPFANNSSYPGVALAFVERGTAIEDCLGALQNVNLGYSKTACDGGLDRPRGAVPFVNGLGAPGDERAVRTALAPLALYAMARLGNTGASALGITRSGRQLFLLLPIPTRPVSFEMLRSMVIGIKSPDSWAWSEIGAEWIYHASREYLSDRKDIDIVWSGGMIRRGELKELRMLGPRQP